MHEGSVSTAMTFLLMMNHEWQFPNKAKTAKNRWLHKHQLATIFDIRTYLLEQLSTFTAVDNSVATEVRTGLRKKVPFEEVSSIQQSCSSNNVFSVMSIRPSPDLDCASIFLTGEQTWLSVGSKVVERTTSDYNQWFGLKMQHKNWSPKDVSSLQIETE